MGGDGRSRRHHRFCRGRQVEPLAIERIDKWLRSRLESGDLPDVAWVDRPRGLFSIAWRHGSSSQCRRSRRAVEQQKQRQDESPSDSGNASGCDVFHAWERHRGRAGGSVEYRRLKQTLRCALNGSRRHLRYRRDLSRRSGADACRVYQFLAGQAPASPPSLGSSSGSSPDPAAALASPTATVSDCCIGSSSRHSSGSSGCEGFAAMPTTWLGLEDWWLTPGSSALSGSCDPYMSAPSASVNLWPS